MWSDIIILISVGFSRCFSMCYSLNRYNLVISWGCYTVTLNRKAVQNNLCTLAYVSVLFHHSLSGPCAQRLFCISLMCLDVFVFLMKMNIQWDFLTVNCSVLWGQHDWQAFSRPNVPLDLPTSHSNLALSSLSYIVQPLSCWPSSWSRLYHARLCLSKFPSLSQYVQTIWASNDLQQSVILPSVLWVRL